jgi:hypothetical protein
MKTLLNVVFFQLLWLVCVGGAGRGYWWVGLPVMALFAAYHFKVTPWRVADGKLLLIAIVLGGIVDTLFVQLGLMLWSLAYWAGRWPITSQKTSGRQLTFCNLMQLSTVR